MSEDLLEHIHCKKCGKIILWVGWNPGTDWKDRCAYTEKLCQECAMIIGWETLKKKSKGGKK